jgi:MSHA biogenesis protein MshP
MVTVIVVLGALAVFGASLVVIATTQQAGAALDFQGVRAYHAARGGLEWGLYQVLRNGQPCAAISGQTVVYGGNLAGFSATLGCVSSVHEEGSSPVTLFTVTATGCNQPVCAAPPVPPPLDYVNRQLQATVGSN